MPAVKPGFSGLGPLVVTALILTACSGRGEQAARRPLPVATQPVTLATFTDKVEAIATLEAEREVQLAAQVNGRVIRLLVRQGQVVQKGQLLLVLDQSQLQAELATLRAQMLNDKLNFERYERLVREGAASAIQRDQFRQASIASRQALLARQADLAFRYVRAPQAGTVGEINLKPGDVLQAGVPFTRLVSNSALNAEIELPANLVGTLRVGMPVKLHAPGSSAAELRTRISAIEPSVATTTQLLMAQAPVRDPSPQWRNGLRVRADVLLGNRQHLAVPFAAVTRLADQSFVYVVGNREQLRRRPGRADLSALAALPPATRFALQIPIQLGLLQDGRYPVLAGLTAGQRVITSGLLQLRHGMPVKPRRPGKAVSK